MAAARVVAGALDKAQVLTAVFLASVWLALADLSILVVFCAWADRRARMGPVLGTAIGADTKDQPTPRPGSGELRLSSSSPT